MTSLLFISFLFLIAGVIAVPIATRFGLGSVLGYLIAGIVLSPILRLLGVDVISIQHVAEFGVVMMLFLVGLELEPKLLWEMRNRLIGLGGLQVGLTLLLVCGICMLLGYPLSVSLAIGCVLSLSSTAIVLQTLNEKGLMKSDGGQASFSVLLFQDIVVIPMLALLPLLAMTDVASMSAAGEAVEHASQAAAGHDAGHGDHGTEFSLIDGLSGWMRTLVTLAAIAVVVVGGNYLTRPVFRFIAQANLREIFTASALLLVVGIAFLMTLVGLSPALGTFLAGVVLANSEYRHELESDIEPFKGLLLGLFFITVGASIDFALLWDKFAFIILATVGLMLVKIAVLYLLAVIFKIGGSNRWLFSLGLAQAGEFGFVLLSFTVANSVIPQEIADQLLLVVALSMLATPLLFILYEKVLAPKLEDSQEREDDEINEKNPIIIAGVGRFGGIVNRLLVASGHKTVVLDYSSSHLERLRAFGIKSYFGDATRPDLLHAAGIEEAKMLIIAIDDRNHATELVRYVSSNHPHVYVIARAIDRTHVYELWAAGCRDIIRETFDSALRTGRSALEALGAHPFEAERAIKAFVNFDRKVMLSMAEVYDPDVPAHLNEAYVERAKALMEEQDQMMRGEGSEFAQGTERGWVPPIGKNLESKS